MIAITDEIRALITASPAPLSDDEYRSPADNLVYCRKCGTPRQTAVQISGQYRFPRCLCRCQQQAYQRREEEAARRKRFERIERRKARGLQAPYLREYTFAHDNGQNPLLEKARSYAAHWPDALHSNTGLLLFGDVGTGKSFFAGCVANALLEQDVPVLMTNFPHILSRLSGLYGEAQTTFLASLNDYDLLILDDLGVERDSSYAMEQMFRVVDARYCSRKPMIVTTNLSLDELRCPPDLPHARIYDRILERCAPILFSGPNFRTKNAAAVKAAARRIVNSSPGNGNG